MKKIVVYGYIDKNLGDDLFISILCQRYPQHKFVLVTSSQHTEFTNVINNLSVKFIPNSKLKNNFNYLIGLKTNKFLSLIPEKKILGKSDAAILIGGSMFMQPRKWQLHAKILQKQIEKTDNFYILGCNFGPYDIKKYQTTYSEIFSKATDVCMRDEKSAKLFERVPTVRQSTDIVFGMKHEKVNKEKLCLISVIDLDIRPELQDKFQIYKEIIKKYTQKLVKKGYDVKFVSFCEPQGDLKVSKEIIANLNLTTEQQEKVSIYDYRSNLEEVLDLFNKAELVIATRFHAMILALVNEAKVLPVIYSEKMTNVLEDVDFQGPQINIIDMNEKYDANRDILKLVQSQILDISSSQELAELQFAKLDLLLNQKD